jgi:hypothetical protein
MRGSFLFREGSRHRAQDALARGPSNPGLLQIGPFEFDHPASFANQRQRLLVLSA